MMQSDKKLQDTIHDVMISHLMGLMMMGAQGTILAIIRVAINLLDDDKKLQIYEMLKDYPWES